MIKYNVIIRNAKIVDGTGNPYFKGDVGIIDDKIAYIGKISKNILSDKMIDAKNMILTPGFIDTHTHSDFLIFRDPIMLSKLKQGVTTQMIGSCGISPAPVDDDKIELLDEYAGFLKAGVNIDYNWTTFGDYLNTLDSLELGTNIGASVGHGTIRINATGLEARDVTEEELEKMKNQTRQALKDGAFGMTSGLIYPPGVYSNLDEMIEIVKVLKEFNGIYLSHLRNESNDLINSVKELISVGEETGVAVQVHHHKACGESNWGIVKDTVEIIENARKRGVDVTLDQYPYDASSTTLRAVMPPWANEGGVEKIIQRLNNIKIRNKIIAEIKNNDKYENYYLNCGGFKSGAENILLLYTPFTPEYEGKNFREIAMVMGKDPINAMLDVIIANKGTDSACFFYINEDDIKYVMNNANTMIGSDSIPVIEGARTHPRTNGTFPRVLGKYVREEKTLSLEEAIRKMTSFPAARFNIKNKGLIREGMDADIVIFDESTIIDCADYVNPSREPIGIHYVLVNGQIVLDNGKFTGTTSGKVLRRK